MILTSLDFQNDEESNVIRIDIVMYNVEMFPFDYECQQSLKFNVIDRWMQRR